MQDLTPGLELGARFVLVRRIGRGGSAEVWLASDRERGGDVALKFFDESLASDPLRFAQLEAEVAHAASLPAAHVVGVHGLLRDDDGRVFLVMDHLEGGDLGQLRGRSFESWSRAVDDVAAALEALHARGLVHRDLKTSNVFLDADGRARLGDFGLTALAGAAPAGHSPYNASPQQLRGDPAQPSDDLYAFGALLYELISGYPPYYPEITRDRVLHEPVPPLMPRGAVPAGVRELALRLLSKSVSQRPANATIVRAKLAVAAADESGALKPLAHEPLPLQAPAKGRRSWLLPAGIGAAVVAAIAAIVLLPRAGVEESAFARKAREEARQAGLARQSAEAARASAAAAREQAEAARERFATAFKSAESKSAARWATADFARARDGGNAAAQRFAAGDYAAAASGWDEASTLLKLLEESAPKALADAVKRGEEALAAAKTSAAREAFTLALAIQPGHPPAVAGIARADRLDQALALVDAARRDEQAGRGAAAEAGYRKALAVDAAVPGAQEALERIVAGRSADAFSVAMSRGFAESAAGRNDAARAAFNEALAARPGSREAQDAIAALDRGQRASAVALLEARARSAESDERWDEAVAAWREAASLEPTLESAREGLARATPRAELQRRIDALTEKPERLWNAEGRAEARGLVAAAQAAGNPREKLAASSARLEQLAAAAQSPIRLRLESDGQTQVMIYRVGQYGAFATREVQLLPGRYTVVGTRNGYRDVRREVVLPPGAPSASVVVRCEEPI